MKITKNEIRILVSLFRASDGLTPYVFFQRYGLSPAQVFKITTKFKKKDFVSVDNNKFFITERGKEFIINNKFIYDNVEGKPWRIPKEFLDNKLDINDPYIPNISKLSKEVLNLTNKGDS